MANVVYFPGLPVFREFVVVCNISVLINCWREDTLASNVLRDLCLRITLPERLYVKGSSREGTSNT
jgi:hypothetical protein